MWPRLSLSHNLVRLLYFIVQQFPRQLQQTSNGSRQANMCLQAIADSEGPDQTARMRSLIRAFTVCEQNHWLLQNVWMDSKGSDDTLRMRTMIWICEKKKKKKKMRIVRMFEDILLLNRDHILHVQAVKSIIRLSIWSNPSLRKEELFYCATAKTSRQASTQSRISDIG